MASYTHPTSYPSFPDFSITFPLPAVAHVEINRASKLNAFTRNMFDQYEAIFVALKKDVHVRAIVLSGTGDRAFTAGLDLVDNMGTLGQGGEKDGQSGDLYRKSRLVRESIVRLQAGLNACENVGKPVISLLHGISYGLALDLSTATDIRIATSTARLALKEVDIGIAADLGTLTRFPKIVGSMGWVKELAYTARDFTAEEAYRHGFVNYVEKDKAAGLARAFEIAGKIAEKSPVAIEGTKEILDYSVGRPVEDGLKYTQTWNAPAIFAKDVSEAVKATMSKRKPRFEKL